MLSNGTFSSDFHIYGLQWTSDNITFLLDGQAIGTVSPPAGGFWQYGGFNGTNIWANGTKMAPFDQPVSSILEKQRFYLQHALFTYYCCPSSTSS